MEKLHKRMKKIPYKTFNNSPIYDEWQVQSAMVMALPQQQACQDSSNYVTIV